MKPRRAPKLAAMQGADCPPSGMRLYGHAPERRPFLPHVLGALRIGEAVWQV